MSDTVRSTVTFSNGLVPSVMIPEIEAPNAVLNNSINPKTSKNNLPLLIINLTLSYVIILSEKIVKYKNPDWNLS